MFASLEVLAAMVVLWFYAGAHIGGDFAEDAWKGYLIMAGIIILAKLILLFIMRHFRALYVLLAVMISAGWAWIGFKLAPMVFSSADAPFYAAGFFGLASLLEKFLQPEIYFEDHDARVGQTLNEGIRSFFK